VSRRDFCEGQKKKRKLHSHERRKKNPLLRNRTRREARDDLIEVKSEWNNFNKRCGTGKGGQKVHSKKVNATLMKRGESQGIEGSGRSSVKTVIMYGNLQVQWVSKLRGGAQVKLQQKGHETIPSVL